MLDPLADALDRGIDELLGRHEQRPSHVLHVRDLALQLFDCLKPEHGLGREDFLGLNAAACLHDIGWSVTFPEGRAHHKASARLIREHAWQGVERMHIDRIALVARYHRKSEPCEVRHRDYAVLDAGERRRVDWLAAMLRVADGLDRRHEQRVRSVRVVRGTGVMSLIADGETDLLTEIQGATRKSGLLARLCGGALGIQPLPVTGRSRSNPG